MTLAWHCRMETTSNLQCELLIQATCGINALHMYKWPLCWDLREPGREPAGEKASTHPNTSQQRFHHRSVVAKSVAQGIRLESHFSPKSSGTRPCKQPNPGSWAALDGLRLKIRPYSGSKLAKTVARVGLAAGLAKTHRSTHTEHRTWLGEAWSPLSTR